MRAGDCAAVLARLEAVAEAKACTPAQLALAWVQARGDDVVPIPGTKRRRWLEENLGALDVELDADDLARLDAVQPTVTASPDRR